MFGFTGRKAGSIQRSLCSIFEQNPYCSNTDSFFPYSGKCYQVGMRHSGLGLMGKNFKDIKAGGRPARAAISRQISGSIITVHGIIALYQMGWLTGPAPDNGPERDRFYREGKLPWAILLFGRYYSLAAREPFTSHLKIILTTLKAGDAYSKKQSKALIGRAIGHKVSEALMDQTYFMGIKMLFDAVTNPCPVWRSILSCFITGMTLPTGLGHLARITY